MTYLGFELAISGLPWSNTACIKVHSHWYVNVNLPPCLGNAARNHEDVWNSGGLDPRILNS
jgi:hypothetical protein